MFKVASAAGRYPIQRANLFGNLETVQADQKTSNGSVGGWVACALVSSLWGIILIGYFRTTSCVLNDPLQDTVLQIGFGMLLWIGSITSSFIFLSAKLVGMSTWKSIQLYLLPGFLVVLAFQLFCLPQELLARNKYGATPNREIFVSRWPPFGNHGFLYSPGYGWFGHE